MFSPISKWPAKAEERGEKKKTQIIPETTSDLIEYPSPFSSPPNLRILSHIHLTWDGLHFGKEVSPGGSGGLGVKKFSFCDDMSVASACFMARNRFLSFLIMAPLGLGRAACWVTDHIGTEWQSEGWWGEGELSAPGSHWTKSMLFTTSVGLESYHLKVVALECLDSLTIQNKSSIHASPASKDSRNMQQQRKTAISSLLCCRKLTAAPHCPDYHVLAFCTHVRPFWEASFLDSP